MTPMSDPKLSDRAEEAAQTVEDVSMRIDYPWPTNTPWTALSLRKFAAELREEGL